MGVLLVHVSPNSTILELKGLIEEISGFSLEKQHLVYHSKGQDIELDDENNLDFYGIANRACITL